jgi:hypothetical protein
MSKWGRDAEEILPDIWGGFCIKETDTSDRPVIGENSLLTGFRTGEITRDD